MPKRGFLAFFPESSGNRTGLGVGGGIFGRKSLKQQRRKGRYYRRIDIISGFLIRNTGERIVRFLEDARKRVGETLYFPVVGCLWSDGKNRISNRNSCEKAELSATALTVLAKGFAFVECLNRPFFRIFSVSPFLKRGYVELNNTTFLALVWEELHL
jgi:hypothetical protein